MAPDDTAVAQAAFAVMVGRGSTVVDRVDLMPSMSECLQFLSGVRLLDSDVDLGEGSTPM